MTIKISHLVAQGLPERLIESWQRRFGGDTLLPLQQEAVARTGLLRGESLLLLASTSAGKTFVAEMAAALHLERRRRVIYLVPTKALAEEKFQAFRAVFAPLGWRVFCAIQERPECDRPVLGGAYDLVVAVYEKMKGYLVQHPEILHNAGVVVIDEVQNLGDASRGVTLEFILAKIAASPARPQLIGLSAVLGNAAEVAEAIGCRVWSFQGRPVELREGVFDLTDNTYYYQSTETGRRGEERLGHDDRRWAADPDEWYREGVLGLAGWLARESGEQIILFVPSRGLSRRWARQLADEVPAPPARRTLETVIATEESYSRTLLGECLEAGVAFHNADLPFALRAAIEEGYNAGEIRVLVSTSTLAQGVNLMSRNVLQIPAMVEQDEWSGRPVYGALSRQVFRNQGGRAGRLGHAAGFGRSIIVAAGADERERLMREYVESPLESVPPMLATAERLDKFLLDLVATGLIATGEKLKEFFLDAYSGRKVWRANPAPLDLLIREGLGRLERAALITRPLHDWWSGEDFGQSITPPEEAANDTITPQSAFIATGLGEAAAVMGIMPESARLMGAWLAEFQPKSIKDASPELPTTLEVLFVAALTPDARLTPIPLHHAERQRARYWQEVRACLANELDARPKAFLKRILDKPGGATEADEQAAKKALLLDTWITEIATIKIESKYETLSGSIHNLSAYFLWLIQSLARAGDALGSPRPLTQWLGRLAERLAHGLPEEGIGWSRWHHPALHRHHIQALLRNGWSRPEHLLGVMESDLATLVGATCAHALLATLSPAPASSATPAPAVKGAKPPSQPPLPPQPSPAPAPEESAPSSLAEVSLALDTTHPGEATLLGERLLLSPLTWRLLWALMREPGRIVTYQRIMEFVWEGAIVEQQQVSFHTRNLRRAFAPLLGIALARELIRPRPGQGLILQLTAAQVRLME